MNLSLVASIYEMFSIKVANFGPNRSQTWPKLGKKHLWKVLYIDCFKLYTEQSIEVTYQVSVHLATRFQRRRLLRNQPIRKKKLPVEAIFVNGSGQNEAIYIEDLP
jgi:hypothetical protein